MSHVRGMVVRLETEPNTYAGTDDHIYVGVEGTGGGREFPLATDRFNDFEPGQDVKYWLGDVWDDTATAGAQTPHEAHDWHHPVRWLIDLDRVDRVYVRKGGTRAGTADNAYQMDAVTVTLYGLEGESRRFERRTDLWLGNEYGLQVWVPEV